MQVEAEYFDEIQIKDECDQVRASAIVSSVSVGILPSTDDTPYLFQLQAENDQADSELTESQAASCCLLMDAEKVEPEDESTPEIDMTYIHLFLLKYLCPSDGCEGTLVPNSHAGVQVCNKCGTKRTEEDFLRELEETDTMLDNIDQMEGDE